MDFRMSPLRDYTEAELMALPADSRLIFADGLADGVVTYDITRPPAYDPQRRRIIRSLSPVSRLRLKTALKRVGALRCISHGLSAFSLYPTTDMQYNVNKFLWQAANKSSFRANAAAALFNRNVFILSMPASLFDFLTSVTWEQFERALLFVLVNLANDEVALDTLRTELAPALARRLTDSVLEEIADSCDVVTFKLLMDHVLDRVVWMGPWIVPTTLCYLSASDMTELLARRFQRPIFATPEKFELIHSMMWNIYRDWQTYKHVLITLGGLSQLDALQVMARVIAKGRQADAEQSIDALMQSVSTSEGSNLLSGLPADIILSAILPKVCQGYASEDPMTKRNPSAIIAEAIPEDPPSPVAAPFSLKSWVLEDRTLQQFYAKYQDENEDQELVSGFAPLTSEGNEEGLHVHVVNALEITPEPELLATNPIPEASVVSFPNIVDGIVEGENADDADGSNTLGGWCSPRSQRRRLNEQGSFQIVTSVGDHPCGV